MSLSMIRRLTLQNALRRPAVMRGSRFMGTAPEGAQGELKTRQYITQSTIQLDLQICAPRLLLS